MVFHRGVVVLGLQAEVFRPAAEAPVHPAAGDLPEAVDDNHF